RRTRAPGCAARVIRAYNYAAPGALGGSDPHRAEVPPHPRIATRHRRVLSSRLPPRHNQPHARVRTARIRVRHLRTVQRTAHQSHIVHAPTIADAAPRVRRLGRLGGPSVGWFSISFPYRKPGTGAKRTPWRRGGRGRGRTGTRTVARQRARGAPAPVWRPAVRAWPRRSTAPAPRGHPPVVTAGPPRDPSPWPTHTAGG